MGRLCLFPDVLWIVNYYKACNLLLCSLTVLVSGSWYVQHVRCFVKVKFLFLMKPQPRWTWKLMNSFNKRFGGSLLTVPCLLSLTGSTPSWIIQGTITALFDLMFKIFPYNLFVLFSFFPFFFPVELWSLTKVLWQSLTPHKHYLRSREFSTAWLVTLVWPELIQSAEH